ncbi:hypothetical protein CEXT_732891 [Caerostris extrusa]|uniref:Uncharacterized protein n=1 Tax=Caerostris extrusa TaxID=172846 RepID=A0AAV4QZI3_CAEEX|nr:hypothetical protein CEXT_732891 [Caerostris extrusa]
MLCIRGAVISNFPHSFFNPPSSLQRDRLRNLHLSHPVFGQNGRAFWNTDVLSPPRMVRHSLAARLVPQWQIGQNGRDSNPLAELL